MAFVAILGIGALSLAFGLFGSCGVLWLVFHLMARNHTAGWSEGQSAAITETVGSKRRAYKNPPTPDSHGQINSNDPRATTRSQASPSTPAPSPSDVQDSLLTRAPTIAEIRTAGLFARPQLIQGAISNEPPVSIQSFVTNARDAAAKAHIDIGGRLTLDPKWKCWSSTPTSRVRR